MNVKTKGKLYSIIATILYTLGFIAVILATANEKLDIKLSTPIIIVFKITGLIFIAISLLFIILYLNSIMKSDKDFVIEENDERNKMIRGKAAEKTLVIVAFSMFILEFLFICLKENLAAILLSIVMFTCVTINLILISYYQKKY